MAKAAYGLNMTQTYDRRAASAFSECRVAGGGIMIDDVWYPPLAYTSYLPRGEIYRQIASCGLHLYCFPAYLAGRGINIHSGIGPFRSGIWRGIGSYDFSDIHTDMDKLLAADPQCRVIMRLHLDVPEWWELQFPEACCRRSDGTSLRQSFASPVWRETVSTAIRDIISWLAASRYAPALAGVHVAAGGTEEWVYHYFDRFEDENPARLDAFRVFLAAKYATASARDAAWADSGVANEQEALTLLGRPAEQRWRDPARDAAALDLCRSHSLVLVDAITAFCRVVKEASQGRLLTGAFYGYHLCITDVRKGHTALSRLLDCPDLDYLASPNYYHRVPGYDWPPMVATDSVRLHGKLWLAENDTRTCLTQPLADSAPAICPPGQYSGGVWEGPKRLDTSINLLRTNIARMLTHAYGGWWFDMWGGWFSHPDLLAEIAAAQRLWQAGMPLSDARVIPDDTVCVITDERLADYDASYGYLCRPILANRDAIATCGRPSVAYLRTDFERLDLSHAPCLWLLGFGTLTASERELAARCAVAGTVVLHTDFTTTRRLDASGTAMPDEDLGQTLSATALRTVLDDAGIHAYLETPDVLYVGQGYLAIHAAAAGEKVVRLPHAATICQVLPSVSDPFSGDTFACNMAQHETRIFRVEYP